VAFSLAVSFSTALLVVGIEKAQMQINAHIPSNIIFLLVSNATAEGGTSALFHTKVEVGGFGDSIEATSGGLA
jgi:hypothetical protein